MPSPNSPWPARDDELRKLWSEGLSTNRIAEMLGATKNQIAGRAFRLKLERAPEHTLKNRENASAARRRPNTLTALAPEGAEPMTAAWTPEREERLKRLWEAGESCQQIAKALGCIGRSAVQGKARRLGLTRSVEAQALGRKLHQAVKPMADYRPEVAPAKPYTPKPQPPHEGPVISVQAVGFHHCRWPIGTPGDAEFGFCGRDKARGSYCAAHARIAYQPAPAKSRAA